MKKAREVLTACLCVASLVLSGCGALGAAGEVVCKTAAIVPDETLALGAAVGGMVSGPKGAMAAKYAESRPISRICAEVDEEVDLVRDLAIPGLDAAEQTEQEASAAPEKPKTAPHLRLAFDGAAALPDTPLRSLFAFSWDTRKWTEKSSPAALLPS